MTLVEFLAARLADDQALAERGWSSTIVVAETEYGPVFGHGYPPARVLREVDAKRQIILDYEEYERLYNTPASNHLEVEAKMLTLLRALQWMATPYADHPDYREEFRP